ncbi:PucR family transcriptional regulator [Paenibacillus sp. GCM10023252]|uniref:PucR family transcriptional regulator n=1 Tax=Paenibacillus sp. GCM10023252 TaxID=3252649 RepID=UPI003607438D
MSAITVHKLITSKPYLFGEQPVISGRQGLDRIITNVNVMEVPDVYRWVRQGDLLLTTAYSIKDNEEEQEKLIPKLAEVGIAALAIKTGRYIKEVPLRMIEMSEQHHFPILSLNYNIGYSQTISEVLEEILSHKTKWLTVLHDNIQLLTRSILMGENIRSIVETIAGSMGVQAALLLHTKECISTDPLMPLAWPDGSIELDGDKVYYPIEKNQEVIGYLVCWSLKSNWDEYALFVQHAVALLTLQLSKQQALHDIEDSQRDRFLKTWILGEMDEATIVLHAAMVGMELKSQYYVCVTSKLDTVSYKETARLRSAFITQGIILISLGTELALLVSAEQPRLDELFYRLLNELRQTLKQPLIRMGISERKSFGAVHEGYEDSLQVLELGMIIYPNEPISRYEKLGMYPIVHLLAEQKGIHHRLTALIEPLQRYDHKNQSKLIETLTVFLRQDGNVKETAARLFCHYNSVTYRLDKIQSLLGVDMRDPETKFQLQMALRVLEYAQLRDNLTDSNG